MCHQQNFVKIGQTILEISQFFDFQDGRRPPSWIFDFFLNFFSPKSVKRLLRYSNLSFFKDGGRPPFWNCGANFGTTHNENLVVFITVQNLVGIALVVLIIQKFNISRV